MSKLGDFVRVQGGYAFKSSELSDDKTGVPVIKIGNITGGSFVDLSNYQSVSFQLFEKTKSFATKDNDILIAMTGANVGKTSRVPVNSDAYLINQRVGRFLLKEDCPYTSDFIYYVVSSKQAYQYFSRVADGAAQPNISGKTIEDLEFPNIDSRCANKIGNILKSLDDKIQLNTQINQTLEQIAQTIFKSWFIDFDPVHAKANALASGQTAEQATQVAMAVISGKNTQELHRLQTANPEQYQQLWEIAEAFPSGVDEEGVPRGWESKKVGEVAKIVKGKSYKSSELAPSKTALVTLKSFNRGGGYRLDGLKEYTGNYKEEQEVFAGDLIIAYTDVTQAADVIGKPAMVMSDSCYEHLVISLDVGVVRPKNEKHKYFLYCLAMTDTFQAHTHSFCTGTTVLHLGKDAVPSFEFILPDNKFIELFDEFVLPIFVRINNI
ncbi:restriction endonuclease subunit S, partial [Glaesserella parasuis]|uniref:restriction endonuclease subunit S n=1 Tax=Glaesserella parasuis TaxID=738 RepID=UPI0009BD352E